MPLQLLTSRVSGTYTCATFTKKNYNTKTLTLNGKSDLHYILFSLFYFAIFLVGDFFLGTDVY